MQRDYEAIGKNILLSGLFSEYLPPCFSLNKVIAGLGAPPQDCDLVAPCSFTMSRYTAVDARRQIFLPEIASYLVVHKYMVQSGILQELIEFSEDSNHSFSPILGKDDEIYKHEQSYGDNDSPLADTPSDYIENIAKKIKRAQGAKQILKLDVANCFSSYYTHMIPAITLGLEEAKKQYELSLCSQTPPSEAYKKYGKLDKLLRRQNHNRTNGLLVGPLTSKILIEAAFCRIDKDLEEKELVFSRYMDDYEICLFDKGADETERIVAEILRKYCFSINHEKTEVVSFPYYAVSNLEKIFQEHSRGRIGNAGLIELFTAFSILEREGTKGAIRYLLKSIEKDPINIEDSKLYKAYLFTVLENDQRSLSKVCTLLIENKKRMEFFIDDKHRINKLVERSLALGRDLEVIWLTYLLDKLGYLDDNIKTIKKIVDSDNELAQLILFRSGALRDEEISSICASSKSWILLYELFVAGCAKESDLESRLGLRKSMEFYCRMKDHSIHFCTINKPPAISSDVDSPIKN